MQDSIAKEKKWGVGRLMANAILNFHFDYPHPSHSSNYFIPIISRTNNQSGLRIKRFTPVRKVDPLANAGITTKSNELQWSYNETKLFGLQGFCQSFVFYWLCNFKCTEMRSMVFMYLRRCLLLRIFSVTFFNRKAHFSMILSRFLQLRLKWCF